MTGPTTFVPLDLVDFRPDDLGVDLGDLRELTASLRGRGATRPITLQRRGCRYLVTDGHADVVAARLAGRRKIRAAVDDTPDGDPVPGAPRTPAPGAVEHEEADEEADDVDAAAPGTDVADDVADDRAEDLDADVADDLDAAAPGTDVVGTYLAQIRATPLLTAAQEVALARRIEAGVLAQERLDTATGLPPDLRRDLEWIARDGRRARDHMVEANLRLVVSIAKKYRGRGLAFADLIQDGNVGLLRAVERFDFARGFKFSTLADHWIRQSIGRGVSDRARTIRVPTGVAELIARARAVQNRLYGELGYQPTVRQIGEELDMLPEKAQQLLACDRPLVSLDQPIGDGGQPFGDIIADPAIEPLADVVVSKLAGDAVRSVLATLPDTQARILSLRLGVGGEPKSLDEVGALCGMPRARVRQLESKAVAQLRATAPTHLLEFAS